MKHLLSTFAVLFFLGCSKSDFKPIDKTKLNEGYAENSTYLSAEYEYKTDPVIIGDKIIIPSETRKRRNVIKLKGNGKYDFYFTPNKPGFPYDEKAIELNYVFKYPNLTIESTTVIVKPKNGQMDYYFVLNGLEYNRVF